MDPLKFQVAIDNKKALESIENVQNALNNLSGKTLTINAEGLQGLSDLIKSIGKDGGVVKIQLPDLSQITDQLKTMKGVTDALFSKQNWQDIPAFTKALAQVSQLSTALDELASKKNIALNSGRNSATSNGILGLQASLAEVFQQLPNTNIKSALEYFKQFQIEFDKLKEKMQTPIGSAIAKGTQAEFDKLRQQFDAIGNLANTSGGLKEFQTQIKTIVATLVQGMVEVQQAIRQAKTEIQNDNFSAFSKRIENAAIAMNGLVEAFGKFNLTIGQDQSLKDFMTGLGEVIRNVRTTMGSLTGETGTGKIFSTVTKSIEQAKYEFYEFTELMRKAAASSRLGKQFSDVDTAPLDKAIERLNQYRSVLLDLKQSGFNANEQTTSEFKQTAAYKEAVAEVKKLIAETEALETNQRRYNTMLEQTKALRDRISNAQSAGTALGLDTSGLSRSWLQAYDFKEKLQRLSEKDQKNTHIVNELAAEYMKLAQALTHAAKEQEKLNAATEKGKKKADDERVKQLQREETNQRRVNGAYEEAQRLLSRLESTGMKGLSLGLDVAKIDDARNKLDEFINKMVAFDKYADSHATTELIGNFNVLRRSLVEAAKAQDQLNEATEKANKDAQKAAQKQQEQAAKQAAQVAKDAQKENEKWAASQAKAGEEANKLAIKIRELQRVEQSGSAVGVDTSKLKAYIRDLETYRSVLESIANGYRGVGHTSDWLSGRERVSGADSLGNTIRLANEASAAVQRLTNEEQKAASATAQLTAEEQRLAQALNQTSEHAKGQSQVLSDLKSMAMQYLGVWGGQQFLHNIIEIGGQLEMQRMSIGAILQNQSQANDLFEKIKGLAVQSPFGVVELDQMTKQLTAYGFKYNELYDMTKRLADISAATGTGVDRLALALGHVRSEAALSGYTLRQFSMGNVPLLAKLSEKLGKTTQEIRKMVRSKEISYEDVEGVIKDLTNEGGMFYNMQETISQSVKARFKNVKDAMDIMYGEMAESGIGDALKSIADALMQITTNWKDVATVLVTGVSVWGMQRVAAISYAAALGKGNAAAISAMAAMRRQQVIQNSLAWTYRDLTAAESANTIVGRMRVSYYKVLQKLGVKLTNTQYQQIAATRDQIVADQTFALSKKKITVETIAQQVALGKLSKAEAYTIITNAGLSASEQTLAINTIRSTYALNGFKGAMMSIALAAGKAGLALKSLVFNPAMLGMAAITALVELWQRNNAEMERAKELGDAIFEASQEGLKNTRAMMESTGINAYQTQYNAQGVMSLKNITKSFGVEQETNSRTFLVKPEFDIETAQQVIDEWSQFIRDYAGTPNRLLKEALLDDSGSVRMLKDQFDHLYESVNMVANSQKAIADIADAMQTAQEATGSGWLNEDLVEDLVDYDAALKKYNKSIVQAYHENSRAIKKGIDAARKADALFAKNTEGMSSYSEMLKELVDNSKLYKKAAADAFGDAAEGNADTLADIIKKKVSLNLGAGGEAEKEFQVFKDNLAIMLEGLGQDIENLTPEMKQGLMSMFINKVLGQDKLGRMSKEAKDKFIKDFAKFIGETVDDAEEVTEKRLADWQKRADKVFVVNKDIKVKTKTISSLDEFAQAVQKDLKEKQEYITRNAGHIRQVLTISTGLKLDTKTLDEQIIALGTQVQVLMMRGQTEAAKALNSKIQDELIPYRDALASIEENKKWLKSEGYPEKDPTKDKSKNKSKSEKRYEDPIAKEWRTRIRLLKDANQLYKEWNKKRDNEKGALKRVSDQYGDIFEKWRTDKNVPWKDFKVEDVVKYRAYIQKIVDAAWNRYNSQRNDKSKGYGKEAEEVWREGKKLLEDIDRYDFDEKAKDFTASATKSIEQLNKRWEIFKQTVDTTGDAMLAAQLAGMGDIDKGARTAAESMRNELVNQLEQLGGTDLIAKIPLNIDLDEEEVRDLFLNAIPDSGAVDDYKQSINALVKLYQEWQKLQQKANSEDIGMFSKVIGMANSYNAQLQKINRELKEQLDSIAANPALSEEQKAKASNMSRANAEWKTMKLSADYANLHNRAVAMSAEEYERAEIAIRNMIKRLRELGLLSPEEDVSETQALNKAAQERAQNVGGPFQQFMVGGIQGLRDYYQRIADNALRNRDDFSPNSAEWMKADEEYRMYQEMANATDDEIESIQKAQAAMENLRKAASVLSDFFNAISSDSDGAAAAGSIFGGALGGFSALSGFGPWGMAAGAILGGATAMLQEGDKATERAINKLRGDVQLIEADLSVILKQRERTLGYDTDRSYLRRLFESQGRLVGQYAQNADRFGSDEQRRNFNASWGAASMRDYYANLMSKGSNGYQAEYNDLLEERMNYLAILDEQEQKKKKNNDEIAETQKKIAELDDQIAYFSQDLAKELWSIDIKGWADQLSDALASAFENGTNMAKAYRDTVTNILQQMMQKMMQMSILEPMFESLRVKLFGTGTAKGVFDINNPKGSMSEVTKMITDYFGKGGEGEKAITASMEFMTAFQQGMQNAGLTVLNEASNTLSSGIQGTSEETSDLLAGYVNALRQDVSVNRIVLTQFVTQMWPDYIDDFTRQVTAVENIDTNVQAIMMMMQVGSGAMYEHIAAVRARLDNVVLGIEKFNIK